MAKQNQKVKTIQVETPDGKSVWVVDEKSEIDHQNKLVTVVVGADDRSTLERVYEVESAAIQYAESMGIFNCRIRSIRGPFTGGKGVIIPPGAKVEVVSGEMPILVGEDTPPYYSIVTVAYG